MFVGKIEEMEKIEMKAAGARGAFKQVVIGPEEGWEGHVMRVMTLEQGGMTPKHNHQWPHINYILSGDGILHLDGIDYEIMKGSSAYVPSGVEHQFLNQGDEELTFICIVPEEGEF